MTNDILTAAYESEKGTPLSSYIADRQSEVLDVCGWHINLSRQAISASTDEALYKLAEDKAIPAAIQAMFAGEHINVSEDRAVMHWALRTPKAKATGAAKAIEASLDDVFDFAEKVRAGKVLPGIETVLHIGIGGSDLGPRLLYDAFSQTDIGAIDVRFASNIDPMDLERALTGLDPSTTLVIGISKSFSTEETKYNLDRARDWLKDSLGEKWSSHLAIVTANPDKANDWLGIKSEQLFGMDDSIGGRYSLWSAGSLSCVIAFGADWFRALLAGAHEMDEHFKSAPLKDNLPVRLALIDYWNMTVRGIESEMVLAYANALRLLPSYLQQLILESNGKHVSSDGTPAAARSVVAHWGGEGSIGQHSYHQWLHQGTSKFAAEFVIATRPDAENIGTKSLIAHALAQAEVLANGYSEAEILKNEPGLDPVIVKQKVIPGGHPSLIFANKNFDAKAMGSLIAMYEHRTFVSGKLWELNSFDQWGVERGKKQAGEIKEALLSSGACPDPTTRALVNYFA